MNAFDLIDPDLVAVIPPPINFVHDALDDLRAALLPQFTEIARSLVPDALPEVLVHVHEVPRPDGTPPLRVVSYRPAEVDGQLPAFLHFHGGGYVVLDASSMAPLNAGHAAQLGCVVFSVDYRSAPETPHPGPVEDGYAALVWVAANAENLGVDAARIGVKGESAGGGLAAAVALLARDRGGPAIAFQHLMYPMLDDRTGNTCQPGPHIGQVGWSSANNQFAWAALLGHEPGAADTDIYAAPARATDLADLPPAFIGVGAIDLFVEEDIAYALRLCRAGVPVELHVYPGAFHSFDMFSRDAAVSRQARHDSDRALQQALHGVRSIGPDTRIVPFTEQKP